MTDEAWLHALGGELRRRGLDADSTAQVVAEARTHLRDSGDDPHAAFGPPARYAAAIADCGGSPAAPVRHPAGPIRLAARRISKRYGRQHILADANLTVHAGEVAAVVGANGCGKSTFLRICAGLVSPDTGEVHVDGSIGYCPQQAGTYDFLRPDEHFVLLGVGRDLSRSRARADGRAAAAVLDWDPAGAPTGRHLSGGTRQKLNLVLAGLGEPDVLLLDEPYQGFDQRAYTHFWEQIWRWRDRGAAVVVVTHLLNHLDTVDTVLDLTPVDPGARNGGDAR